VGWFTFLGVSAGRTEAHRLFTMKNKKEKRKRKKRKKRR
jgi:hypothetical protein